MKQPQGLDELPPHAQMVYETLKQESIMTQAELHEETRLPSTVVRDAVEELVAADAIEEIIYSQSEHRLYRLATSEIDSRETRELVSV